MSSNQIGMCSCEAHHQLANCVCQCDHTLDMIGLWKSRARFAEEDLTRCRERCEALKAELAAARRESGS